MEKTTTKGEMEKPTTKGEMERKPHFIFLSQLYIYFQRVHTRKVEGNYV